VLHRYFRGRCYPDQAKKAVKKTCLVTISCAEDLSYFGLFGLIASEMRKHPKVEIETFIAREFVEGESRSITSFIWARTIKRPLNILRWSLLYRSFCHRSEAGSWSILRPFDFRLLLDAYIIWRSVGSKNQLQSMTFDGIRVGDLVNDTYIRFKPAPTVALRDTYLLFLTWRALRLIKRAKRYVQVRRPRLYLTPYSSYIQNGIMARVAIAAGIPVYSFGEYQEFSKELTKDDWFHTINPLPLASRFESFPDKPEKLAYADKFLSARFRGDADPATVYMARSAYADVDIETPDVRGAVIVFMHDFYDSPNLYYDMVFPDFWEWLCVTIETLTKYSIPFFLKPHPNQIPISRDAVADLIRKYPSVRLIPSAVNNLKLVKGGISCAVTVYGSVANEMAYFGIPTICCSRHPHSSFDFCRTAKSESEYIALLAEAHNSGGDINKMRQQALSFYFMFNFGRGFEEKELTDAVMVFRKLAYGKSSGDALLKALKDLLDQVCFHQRVETMLRRILY
jgi:hypothetical protein